MKNNRGFIPWEEFQRARKEHNEKLQIAINKLITSEPEEIDDAEEDMDYISLCDCEHCNPDTTNCREFGRNCWINYKK